MLTAQVEYGYVFGLDFYERFVNEEDELASASAGNALTNLFIGPKMWIGTKKFSFSLEGQMNVGLTTLSLDDYKGIGSLSFPLLAKLNFGGDSGLRRKFKWGFYAGGGMEWVKTELIYLKDSFEDKGVKRSLFQNYVIEVGFGRGGFGMDGNFYFRYGFNKDKIGSVLHLGMVFNFVKSFNRFPKIKF